jgi:hypothetical protein
MKQKLNPRALLAAAGFIPDVSTNEMTLVESAWSVKATDFVACSANILSAAYGCTSHVPETLTLPTCIVSNQRQVGSTLRTLQEIGWAAFIALLTQKPGKGEGLKFAVAEKLNFVHVQGEHYFKVVQVGGRTVWSGVTVTPSNTLPCAPGSLLINQQQSV